MNRPAVRASRDNEVAVKRAGIPGVESIQKLLTGGFSFWTLRGLRKNEQEQHVHPKKPGLIRPQMALESPRMEFLRTTGGVRVRTQPTHSLNSDSGKVCPSARFSRQIEQTGH